MKVSIYNLFRKPSSSGRVAGRQCLDSPLSSSNFVEIMRKSGLVINFENPAFLSEIYSKYVQKFADIVSGDIAIRHLKWSHLFDFRFSCKNTRIDFYLERGFSEKEAKELLTTRQATDSVAAKVARGMTEDEAKKKIAEKAERRVQTIKRREDVSDIYYRKGASMRPEYWVGRVDPITGRVVGTLTEADALIASRSRARSNTYWRMVKTGEKQKPIGTTSLEYYLNLGMDEKGASLALRARQQTRSLESFIRRHGEAKGEVLFNLANSRFLSSLSARGEAEQMRTANKRRNAGFKLFSKWAYEKCEDLQKSLGGEKCLFGSEEMFLFSRYVGGVRFYDFTVPKLKIIVEFNGSHVHPNPSMSETEWGQWQDPFTKKSADECAFYDLIKRKIAEDAGFQVLYVWDTDDWDSRKTEIIKKIKEKQNDG